MLNGLDDFWAASPGLVVVILLVNMLTAIGLVRVYRLVFLGPVTPKTRRSPEVPWTMAMPMGVLVVATVLLPWVMQRLDLLPDFESVNLTAAAMLSLSGIIGVAIGSLVRLEHVWMRPVQAQLRFVQDLLAYDFYVERFYELTVVRFVGSLSSLISWFDRYIVDGVVNLVGFASLISGEGLKYSASGRSSGYMFTILVGVGVLGLALSWSRIQALGF